jgi:hypothetical protein
LLPRTSELLLEIKTKSTTSCCGGRVGGIARVVQSSCWRSRRQARQAAVSAASAVQHRWCRALEIKTTSTASCCLRGVGGAELLWGLRGRPRQAGVSAASAAQHRWCRAAAGNQDDEHEKLLCPRRRRCRAAARDEEDEHGL